MRDDIPVDVTVRCPECGEFVRARVDRFGGTVEFFDLGLCTWGTDPAHGTSYELALVRNQRALEAAVRPIAEYSAAYHAAGHAVAAMVRRVSFRQVRVAAGLDLSETIQALADPAVNAASRRRRARRLIEVCLAGAEAERLLADGATSQECPSCIIDAGAWILAQCPDPVTFRESASARLTRQTERRARRLHALARQLLEHGTLSAAEVVLVLAPWSSRCSASTMP